MGEMLIMDMSSMSKYENALEEFKSNIQKYCTDLETDINAFERFMQDEKSQKALKDARDTCAEIMRCLGHVNNALDMVRELKTGMSNL